ncbi:MAG: hypothetical protein WCE38_19230, partial [Burkholderiales bacterium]
MDETTQGVGVSTYCHRDTIECQSVQTGKPVSTDHSCDGCRRRLAGGAGTGAHGLEKNGRMFCCDHCAERESVTELRDR